MSTVRHRLAHGFTLLELLIALAIFGLLSVMSYSGLTTVLDQHARTDAAADRLGELLLKSFESFPGLYKTLVADRNRRWVRELIEKI